MQWQHLYSSRRSGSSQKSSSGSQHIRTSFVRDYDRLIFSSAFRRLQNKTQVFPLPGAVFVHNRLTHSLEVSSVGRSLGKAIGDALADKYKDGDENFREFYKYELPSVIAAGCLAHDIGNPPFGHSGEDAIRIFFRELEGEAKKRFTGELSNNEQRDLTHFEGNANAFRTLTHSFGEERPGGFQLTYATLASIIKYPSDSDSGFNKEKLVTKKSGFFSTEINTYLQIAEELGIPRREPGKNVFARHPFVFLVEAADDICYRIIDFEDAHRLGIISIDNIAELFLAFFNNGQDYDSRSNVENTFKGIKDDNKKIQFLRARVINLLVHQLCGIFMKEEETLLSGILNEPLIDLLPTAMKQIIKAIDDYSYAHIYNHRSVVEIELAGYTVIGYLLKEFVYAILNPESMKSKKLLQLIPAQFPVSNENSLYSNLQSVTDYIAGMTDLYAVDLYHKMTGNRFSVSGL
ncbi:MAG: deoxyguanosinetriphosphate triphosphohydrolase [Chitinophagaceae bacterium]|nr:deoxyguanosinetriphosphate triphosphohydrolase [Chitinophagaceae bacterium]MCW5928811.1 deoxyguanosinetriphosphate triphosphohydrolase [Chitinophagaceae bacterium]